MKSIYKYPLQLVDEQEIQMPDFILCKCGVDPHGDLCVWAMHGDTNGEHRPRKFFVVGTGHPLPPKAYIWIATVTMGEFVWHIWTP